MELALQKPWVVFYFYNLYKLPIRACTAYLHTVPHTDTFVCVIELIPVSVALRNLLHLVRPVRMGILFDDAGICPKSHRPSFFASLGSLFNSSPSEVIPTLHKVYHRVLGLHVELGAICVKTA